ncbi:membrane protein [Streptomyces fumigatiscleroticus]|nr:membrane protein [Streptomyces fumigatiscleroticus]
MSNSADFPGTGSSPARRRRLRPVRVLTAGVFALAGLIFFTSFDTAKGTNIRTDTSLLKLSDLIEERSRKNGELDESNAALRDEIEGLAERDDGRTKAEDDELAALEKNAGTQKLTGEAVTVTLDDAPPNATAKLPGYPEPQPDYLVIHQQDLQAVVNALWQGGAQGIKVMDQRLISTSAVRCVGNTLILQGRVYSPPYKITAVGDPEKLQKALAASPAIQNYMVYVNVYGLGWKVEEDGTVTLPGYSGTVDLHYAEPVE